MARKKREAAPSGGNAPWMNTFADLMNLLLCFFVLLFAMSTVDAEKFEQISMSLANSIGVLEGGGSAVGTGPLVSSGMSQLNNLDEYYSSMGKSSEQNGNKKDEEGKDKSPAEGQTGSNTQDSDINNEGIKGSQNSKASDTAKEDALEGALDKIEEKMKEVSSSMYDEVSDLTEQYQLGDYVELSIDPEYQFVQINMKGNILFDSGKAEIKTEAQPVLRNIGKVLKKFDGYTVEIVGHTDNVPITRSTYKNNNWLSSARALYTAEFLIENNELNPETIKYSGRGEYEPVSSNKTEAGRAKNRRIEIKIYNEYSGK